MIIIDVTQEDIDQGLPNQPDRCPIALALQRRFPDATSITVWPSDVHVHEGAGADFSCQDFYPSDRAFRFINAFDAGTKVVPQKLGLR